MLEIFAGWLRDDTFLRAYIFFMLAVMALPMVLLARWYHGNIGKTEGGRELMARQDEGRVRPRSLSGAGDAIPMARDIAAGRYGDETRRMQRRVYVYVALWLLAVAIAAAPLVLANHFYPTSQPAASRPVR